MNILIPMAGLGSRFSKAGFAMPKPFIDVSGKTMIQRVCENFDSDFVKFIFVINKNIISSDALAKNLSGLSSKVEIVEIDNTPNGSAISCLSAESLIAGHPLVVVNCDQIISDFKWEFFLSFLAKKSPDAVLGAFNSSSNKNSFMKLDSKCQVSEVREKIVISNIASNGFHYWKDGSMFVDSVNCMISDNHSYNGEYYVAPSFNYLPTGSVILPYYFNGHFPIGTPEDLELYLSYNAKV